MPCTCLVCQPIDAISSLPWNFLIHHVIKNYQHQHHHAPSPDADADADAPMKVLATVQHADYLLCMSPTPLLSTLILWSIHSNPCCFEEKKRQDGGAWHSTEEHGMIQNNEQHPSKALPCCAVLYIPLYVYCSTSTTAIEIPHNINRKCYFCHQTDPRKEQHGTNHHGVF